jgi:hypothetical protein
MLRSAERLTTAASEPWPLFSPGLACADPADSSYAVDLALACLDLAAQAHADRHVRVDATFRRLADVEISDEGIRADDGKSLRDVRVIAP